MMTTRWWPYLHWSDYAIGAVAVGSPCLAVAGLLAGDMLFAATAAVTSVAYLGLAAFSYWQLRHRLRRPGRPVDWGCRDPAARHRAGKGARWWVP